MEPIFLGLNVSRPRETRTDLCVTLERRGKEGEVEQCGLMLGDTPYCPVTHPFL